MVSREFIKDFLVYSLGSILAQLSNIGLMLFLMYHVPTQQVGLFSLSISTILLLSTIVSCGLRQLFMIEFFNLSSEERKIFVNDSIVVYLLCSGLFFVCMLFGFELFNRSLFAGQATVFLYWCIMALTFLTFFTELFFQALMYTMQSVHVTVIKSIAALFILVTSLTGMYVYKAHIEFVISAQLISYIAIVLYASKLYIHKKLFNYIDFSRAFKTSHDLLLKSAPLMPTVIAGLLLASGNRWVLALQTNLADIAVYSLAEYVSPLFNVLILYPLSGAYLPRIMAEFRSANPCELQERNRENKRLMWFSMVMLFIVGICGYFIIKPFAFYFLPKHYYAAIPGAYIVFCANILLMGTYFTSSLIIFKKKSYYLLGTMAIAALINITLSYLLVPFHGIYGCFTGYVVAHGVYFVLMYYCNRVVLHACVAHAQDQQGTQKILGYQPAIFLQEEDHTPTNNKKESSNELEDRNF